MLTPRNAKEMAKILGSDSELRKKVHGIIARVGRQPDQTGGDDRIRAAREILDFNGYDIGAMVMRPGG